MSDPERDKLDELGARIRQAKGEKGVDVETSVDSAEAMKASRIAFDFVSTVSVCVLIGWLIDRELGWQPWGILVMLLVGFIGGFMNLWRTLIKMEDKTK